MSFYYNSFQKLSDKNLLQRIERKDSFQKEAVIAAYQILRERGYELQDPFSHLPKENDFADTKEIASELSSPTNEHHKAFKDQYYQIPVYKIILFLGIFFPFLYYSNTKAKETYLYQQINLFSDLLIELGSISYIIELILFAGIFLTIKDFRTSLFKIDYSNLFVASKVFLFSILFMFVLEILFRDGLIVNQVIAENSYRTLITSLLFGFLVALTEELIFKWLLLTQLLIRVKNEKFARVVIYLIVALIFAASHIPKQISDHGQIDYGHLFLTFLYSYFTAILFVRHNNFLLIVALHFFLNFTVIFVDSAGRFYFFWGLVLVGIYTIKAVSNSFLFKSPQKPRKVRKSILATIIVLPFVIIFFIPKSHLDHYLIAQRYYNHGEKSEAELYVDAALNLKSDYGKSLNLKGNLFYDRDEFQEAWVFYDSSIRSEWKYGTIRNRGLANKELKKYSNCIDDLTSAIRNGIVTARVFANRGTCYLGVDEAQEAKADFLDALEIKPHYKPAYLGLGQTYLQLKKYDSCAYYATQALKIDAKFVPAYELLSMAYTGLKKYDTAIHLMTKAIRMGSTSPTRFYIRGANYYTMGDFYNAAIEFEKSLEFIADDPKLHLILAYSYLYSKQFEKVCEQVKIVSSLGYTEGLEDFGERCKTGTVH